MLDSSFKSERHNRSDASISEETNRILKLRERVNTAQQKLQLLENTKRDARRIFSKLTDSDSPVRPSKDYSSNSALGLNPRQQLTDLEHDRSRLSVTRQNIIDEPETDISQILPTNNKQRILKEILVKMDLFRLNSPSTQKILDYFHEKIEGSKPYYYDFLRENNILVLKVLIQILYEEIESVSNDLENSSTANNNQLDVLEKKLQDKTILCDRLTGELVQQNIELEHLKKRMGPVTQDGNRVSIDHLFFVELKLLLQNILDEIFNAEVDISNDQRMNFRYITKSILDKLGKIDIESLKETYGEDPYRSQDLPRAMPSQDRTSLKYMFGGEKSASSLRGRGEQLYESKYRNAEEDNVKGELLSEINTLKGENRDLRRQLEATRKKGGEQRSSNQDILMDELKRALNEKEKLEDEFQKLKQIYNISKEEINNLSNDIYKVTAEREKEQEILTQENRELKVAMATLEREVKNLEIRLRDDVGKMEAELHNAKERISTNLDEKTTMERELFQLRVDKKELTAKLQSYEVHIDELVTERETVLANVTTYDDVVKNKNVEIERLKRAQMQLDAEVHELREKQKILAEENEFNGNLKQEKSSLQKELKEAKEALKGSEERLVAFQEEKKMFGNKLNTLEAFDTNQLTSASLEQLSKGIIAQANIDMRMSEDERSRLQDIISNKFMQALIPIKHKLKKSESSVNEFKGKYRDKLLNLLERLEDSKWLTNIILQANDALARSDNEQIPGTLIVFKEELERKKEVIKGKLKDMIQQQEANQIELKRVFDEQENQAESFRDNFGLEIKYEDELEKVKDENEKMKAKLQTQSYEIAALNSQLKLASTVEETNKRGQNLQSTRDMRSSRVGKGTRDASRTSNSRYYEEEEDASKSQEAMTSPKDLLLMLQSQASSIEILLGNGF